MEMVVVLAIASIVSIAAFRLLHQNVELFADVFYGAVLQSDGRQAMSQLRYDLQQMDVNGIAEMTASTLRFNSIFSNEVIYSYADSTLSVNGEVLLENMVQPPFVYLDENQDTVASPELVVSVVVTLALESFQRNVVLQELMYARN